MALHKGMAGVVILAALGLTLPGCGRKSASYGSPQEVFDAFKNAAAKEDYKTFTDCLTTDSRKAMTGGLVVAVVMMKQFAGLGGKGGELDAKLKPLDDVMKKYDLKEDAVKQVFAEAAKGGADPTAAKNSMLKLSDSIKDHGAFMADVMGALKQIGGKGEANKLTAFKDAELKDVKTSGDTATGTVVVRQGGSEKSNPVQFRKEDGGWRIDMTEMMMKKGP